VPTAREVGVVAAVLVAGSEKAAAHRLCGALPVMQLDEGCVDVGLAR